jgi:hypothetical protein
MIMEMQQDWAAVEGHRYRAYCELVLSLCRTPATDPAYAELQGRCRDAAGRWQDAYRALHTSRRLSADRSQTDQWDVPLSLLATVDGTGQADPGAH